MTSLPRSFRLFLTRWVPLLALALAAITANAQVDPPGRVAALSRTEGSVAFAPAGEPEWSDALVNRPITRGDRLWTDPGARAEVHLGSAALHLASRTFVEVMALDDDVLQLTLNEGTVNARVRQLEGGENFEVTTPQLVFRATQPGDYRIDVDPAAGYTRVTVRSGVAVIYGAGAGAGVVQLRAGQQMAFTGLDLAAVAVPSPVEDAFDRWASDRSRAEDQSITARHVPREVVGYQELDANGVWSQDPDYGAVWYPTLTVADWAPYRYGRWEWIVPWGWTWIDDARWGFAPFHYGRWAHIGSRWAWVPGRIDRRPVYSPALVAFVGGGGANWNLSIASGPGIGWFPLAPGEAWRPTYRASTVYLRNANRNAVFNNAGGGFFFQHRPEAITAVRLEDFNRGRPVHQHWSRVSAADLDHLQVNAQPVLPQPRRYADTARAGQPRPQPQMQFVAPVAPGVSQRQLQRAQDEQRPRQLAPPAMQQPPRVQQVQQQQRAHRDQPVQQVQQERARRDTQGQLIQQQRAQQQAQQVRQAQQAQPVQRHQRQEPQREQAVRQQQQAGQQQERQQREQQQAAQQHERAQRQQERQQQRAAAPQRQLPQQAAPAPQERGRSDQRAAKGEDDGGRGRGRGPDRVN